MNSDKYNKERKGIESRKCYSWIVIVIYFGASNSLIDSYQEKHAHASSEIFITNYNAKMFFDQVPGTKKRNRSYFHTVMQEIHDIFGIMSNAKEA